MSLILAAMRRIMWTGGFDSTWLLIDALLQGHRVEAVTYRSAYVGHLDWQKAANEDEARRRILHALPSSLTDHLGFNVLADPGYTLPRNVFHEPWHRLREHSPFNATRYAALQHDKGDKLLDHCGRPFHFEVFDFWPDQDWLVGALPTLLPSSTHPPVPLETAYVAGDSLTQPGKRWRAAALQSLGLAMPLLERTKQDLLADARKRGFAHLLDLTWSCEAHGSERSEPCGRCSPCKLRIIASTGHA